MHILYTKDKKRLLFQKETIEIVKSQQVGEGTH